MTLKQTNVLTLTDKDLRRRAEQAYATLSSDGTVPDEQVPGQVTDVLNYDTKSDFPATGDPGRYYRSDATGKTYKWDEESSEYVEVVVPTAAVTSVAGRTGAVTLTKTDVGLSNVVNTGDSATPVEGGTTKFTTGGAYTELAKKANKSEMSVTSGSGTATITLKEGTSATVLTSHQDISGKADKVTGATDGHYATLDANGNLTDSGKGVDTTVTESSGNLVTSGAVATAIGNIDVTSQIKGKLDSTGQAATYASGTAYSVDEIVRYEGNLYRCKTAHTGGDTFDTSKWTLLKLSSDFLTIVKLTDGAETMGSIASRLGTLNSSAQSQHVLFDVGAVVTTPQLYLCTIFIDTASGALRLADQVTGKLYVGTYDSTETLSQVLSKAVDSYVSITVTAATLDGVTVTGQTVYLYEGNSADATRLKQQLAYEGQPVTFTVARGFEYFITISSTLANHFSPSTAHGSANTVTSVVLTYQDTSNITTFAGIQGFLQSITEDETLTTDAERIAFAQNALLPEGNTAKEIADTWTDDNGTVYDNPMVVMDIKYYEDENGDRHLGCKMERKWATHFITEVDERETVVKCSADEVSVSGTGYFSWCAAYDNNSKSYTVNSHCHYNGAVYKCVTAYTSATTDATPDSDAQHWQAVSDPDSEEYLYSTVANQCVPFRVPYTTKVYEQTGANNYYGIYKNGAGVEWNSYYAATRFGCNRWSHSGMRQYLNSDGAAGTWWASQHTGDKAPSYLIRSGYKAGCTAALIAAAKKFKVETINWDDTATSSASGKYIDVCYDTFSIDSITEVFGVNGFGEEGTYDLYWKRAVGSSSPTSAGSIGRVRYKQNAHDASIVIMLRSADRNCSRSGMKAVVGKYYVEDSPAPGAIWGYNGHCSASTRRGAVAPCCVIW